MQKKSGLIIAGLIAFSLAASAQKINTDSLSLVSKISEYQLKRAKLQNTVDKTMQDKADAATKVQNSANQSSQDANRLTNDPQNKGLARKADQSAGDARRDSKKARAANDKLHDLYKEIAKLDDKILGEQRKLSVFTGVAAPVEIKPVDTPVLPDSTRHS
ncbi:hypothetical protein Q4E93_10895 [Flavitalea sp. BT771]|uniref:hypothetical protein n=1 Tax=Flavitalea sp. BT771 TaxID=3063329 RepID=UPI0026E2E96D|nr:hypothetical protein [Flavitalea sp. BT771]MDO6431098.1 hypothetical protein [Flavitalea sp. BT771]MDV6220005.1 hypothetical protein [Flavitalea sp. BT771]